MKNLDILVVYKLFMNNKAILNITFDARIKDGLIKRGAEYKPIMSAPNAYKIYNNIKWFQSGLINNKDLDEAMGTKLNKPGRQMVFLNIQQFNSYVKFMSGKDELSKDISISGGIIEKNISYLLEIFFGNKSSLYLGDKEYTIQGYEWDRTFTPVGDGTPKNIKLRFLLSEGKEKGFMKSVEVSCAQKWDSIKNDFAFLTGFKSDPLELKEYKEDPDISKEENAAAKKQWDEDNKVENDAITKAWEVKNEQAKTDWKKKRATNEKDAPYTKLPRNIDPSLLPIAQPVPIQATNVQGQGYAQGQGIQGYAPGQGQGYAPGQGYAQVQAAQIRAQSAMNVEKIRAREAKKERDAKAEERDAKVEEAEKQRKADADAAAVAVAAAEKQRITQENREKINKKKRDETEKHRKHAKDVREGKAVPSRRSVRNINKTKTKNGGNKRTRKRK